MNSNTLIDKSKTNCCHIVKKYEDVNLLEKMKKKELQEKCRELDIKKYH